MEEKRLHDLGFVTWYCKVWELAASYDIQFENSFEKSVVKDIITRAFKERWFVDKVIWLRMQFWELMTR